MGKKLNLRQKERLTKMAEFLRKVPRKHFNLEDFIIRSHALLKDDICNLKKIGKTFETLNCGTAGCAVGWMPSIFPRSIKWNANVLDQSIEVIYKDKRAWDAVNKFLDFNQTQSNYLFMPDSYSPGRRGPLSVAKRIEKVIKNGFPDSYVDVLGDTINIYDSIDDYEKDF